MENTSIDISQSTATWETSSSVLTIEASEEKQNNMIDSLGSHDDQEKSESRHTFPLLKYSRITGALPRVPVRSDDDSKTSQSGALRVPCQNLALGKVVLVESNTSTSQIKNRDMAGNYLNLQEYSIIGDNNSAVGSLSSPQTYHILALGMLDGTVHLMDPQTGKSYCPSDCLNVIGSVSPITTSVNPSDGKVDLVEKKKSIVDVSFDASGAYLSAITISGDVSIFEFRFGRHLPKPVQHDKASSEDRIDTSQTVSAPTKTSSSSISSSQPTNMFESFLSKLAGDNVNTSLSRPQATNIHQDTNEALSTNVIVHSLSTARFHYHKPMQLQSSSKPTCLVIDPSYRRRKEKAIVVGFDDGRLILTKRSNHGGVLESIVTGSTGSTLISSGGTGLGGAMGLFLQPRRRDIEIYHGVSRQSTTGPRGIEALTWRGSLIAWADSNGIKIFDVENMARIAHIDRPSGAKIELYPTISSLRPSLVFERCDSLLITWGDCLMSMLIKTDTKAVMSDDGEGTVEKQVTTSQVPLYKVDCVMAWQLDCVACDVMPLDSDNVIVLGLVPLAPESDEIDNCAKNLIEIQLINRTNRLIVACDALPLFRDVIHSQEKDSNIRVDDACMFSLRSTFSTPRQENSIEAEDELWMNADASSDNVNSLMQNPMMSYPLIEKSSSTRKLSNFIDPHMRWSIDHVRCLDDDDGYLNNTEEKVEEETGDRHSEYSDDYSFLFRKDSMAIESIATAIKYEPPMLIIKSHVDLVLAETRDIDDAISFARTKGLHGTALRRGLIHRKYLRRHTLRQLVDEYLSALLFPPEDLDEESSKLFTFRRLQLAARSTTMLIGGDIDLWARWIFEFAKIPGGLFILRPHLPVRDPKLPSILYEFILDKLLLDIIALIRKGDSLDLYINSASIGDSATGLYINALFAWGPTAHLNARARYLRREPHEKHTSEHDQAEIDLINRFNQTASSFLQFPVSSNRSEVYFPQESNNIGGASDSLFDIMNIEKQLRYHLVDVNSISSSDGVRIFLSLYFQTMSALMMMRGSYEEAFRSFLYIHSYDSAHFASLEEEALQGLHDDVYYRTENSIKSNTMPFVVNTLEIRHVQQLLLDPAFFLEKITAIDLPLVVTDPIIALISILGLDRSGEFFVEHSTNASTPQSSMGMPIDVIVRHLRPHPKILCWFLNVMLYRKPEIYIHFPNTTNPPPSIIELHTVHFDLLVELTNVQSYQGYDLSEIPRYDQVHQETPLLYLLKKTSSLGGISAVDASKKLMKKRELKLSTNQENSPFSSARVNDVKYPYLFAKELAYLLETCGLDTEDASRSVLYLYLNGASSIPLAVEYAERNTKHSQILWAYLVSFCLGNTDGSPSPYANLFGTLLEVAVRYGADLAFLVAQIPDGLQVEGIRSKLVCAIKDYRVKVKIHDSVKTIGSSDKVCLMQDLHHRARRARRIEFDDVIKRDHVNFMQDLRISRQKRSPALLNIT